MKKERTVLGSYFDLPNPGLRSYFARVAAGNPDEYRTTFARNQSLNQVLNDWKPTIDTLQSKWPTLLDYENDLAKKVGPLSIQKPLSERLNDIDSYYDSILSESKPVSDDAIARVIAEWRNVRSLHPKSHRATVEEMKLSTNSGCPYFTKRRQVLDKTLPLSVEWQGDNILLNQNSETWKACAVLGWRGQEGGPTDEDVKQRVVWMFPFGVNIAELSVYQLLISSAQNEGLVPAWIGLDAVDKSITRLFDTKGRNDLIICTDFTKFDQHFNPDMQQCAKSILSALLDNSQDSHDWLNKVFPIKYEIPLAISMGKLITGKHGMGSGSGGTNADETLAHRALQHEVAMSAGKVLNPNSQCLGDDGILSYPGITVEDVMRSYTAHGQVMNQDKQYASTQDCTYLRRWHHRDYRVDGVCVGVYSTYRALGRLCEQERYYDPDVWGPKMVALRQLSIIENCKYHPLREEFASFCMKRDKFRLGIDIPGFLDNITSIAERSIELMPDFLGYTKSLDKPDASYGIADWWIVKYLKSQR